MNLGLLIQAVNNLSDLSGIGLSAVGKKQYK